MGELAILYVGGGVTRIGELAANPLCESEECVVGAAAALIADTARAKPRATHETFNHDEDIWRSLNAITKTERRLTQSSQSVTTKVPNMQK